MYMYVDRDLIDLLHGGLLLAIIVLFEVWDSVIVIIGAAVDAKAELDEAVDALGEHGGLVEREARSQEERVVKHPDQVLDCLVALVGLALLAELLDDGMEWVDL